MIRRVNMLVHNEMVRSSCAALSTATVREESVKHIDPTSLNSVKRCITYKRD